MGIANLANYVREQLKETPSLILDADRLRQRTGIAELPVTRRNCNLLAKLVTQDGAAGVATAELFQRGDTGEVTIFMIFARSTHDLMNARTELAATVIGDAEVETNQKAEVTDIIVIHDPTVKVENS